ncbi:MAG: hypothetical protein AAGJ81_13520 [Verrucomicrobiota bacterium]
MRTLLAFFLTVSSVSAQQSSTNYSIPISSIDGGNGTSSSSNYTIVTSSIGGIFGRGSSTSYSVRSGYVEQFSSLADFMQGIDLRDYDSWSTQFPGTDLTDRQGDADGDRVSNEDEFIALTDPTDPKSFPFLEILSVDLINNTVELRFSPYETDATLRTYLLLSQEGLTGSFLPVPGVVPVASGDDGTFTDSRTAPERLFYRLRISIPSE